MTDSFDRDRALVKILRAQTPAAACEAGVGAGLTLARADGAAVALYEADGSLRLRHVALHDGSQSDLQGFRLNRRSVASEAIRQGQTLRVGDCAARVPQSAAYTSSGMRCCIAVPLLTSKREPLGALVVAAHRPAALGEDQIEPVELLATALSLRLAGFHDRSGLARLRQLYRALHASNGLLVGPVRGETELYAEVCRICVDEAGFKVAWVARPDAQGWFRTLASGGPATGVTRANRASASAQRPEGQGSMGRAWREGRAVYLQSPLDEDSFRHWHAALRAHGVHGFASVPVGRGGRGEAVLAVGAPARDFFGHEERMLFEELGADLSRALDQLALRTRTQIVGAAVEHAPTGIVVADTHQRIVYANRAFSRLSGVAPDELMGRNGIFFMPDDPTGRMLPHFRERLGAHRDWSGPVWGRNGNRLWEATAQVRHVRGADGASRLVALFGPPPNAAEQELRDGLTGLPNEKGFIQALLERIAQLGDRGVVVVRANVRDLTSVNTGFGRRGGDRVLGEVAARLRQALPADSIVARLGADDFAMVTRPLRRGALARAAQIILDRVDGCFADPFAVAGSPAPLRVASGAALFPADAQSAEALLERADEALGRARSTLPGARTRQDLGPVQTRERLAMAARFKHALRGSDGIKAWYQPKVRLSDGALIGAEALARWHDGANLVSPGVFLPLAETQGLTVALNDRILHHVLQDLVRWRDAGLAPSHVAVNLSPQQFMDDGLAAKLNEALQRYGLAPSLLHVEVTERALITAVEQARATLRELGRMGIQASLDDFGTGYSSLSILRDLPLTRLKLDKSFVDRLPDDERTRQVAALIVDVAHSLDMVVIAEGIEHERQAKLLRELGCDYGQGFLYARPAPGETFMREWLAPR